MEFCRRMAEEHHHVSAAEQHPVCFSVCDADCGNIHSIHTPAHVQKAPETRCQKWIY